jgi:acetyl-CoA carboxylase biotin carboxyl carrier protein
VTDSKESKSAGKVDQGLIRDLANLLSETELSEIEIEQNGLRLRVARQMSGSVAMAAPAPVAAAPAPSAAPVASPSSSASDYSDHPGAVTSPMVGTAYTAPEPGAPAFVKEGDQVSEGQTVVIIEAMKTMNAIPAPKAGRVVKILVGNEQPIEFGEVLVVIE